MPILLKRAYEPADPSDGYRVLVDRLWPRGISKREVRIDIWAKDVAPSNGLREWFGHDVTRWDEFKNRYFRELDAAGKALEPILALLPRARLTLVYAAKNPQFNNAVALKEYIETRRARGVDGNPNEPSAWSRVRQWRRAKRTELIARRQAMPTEVRRAARLAVVEALRFHVPALRGASVGVYWPINGEIDIRSVLPETARGALPVVVQTGRPMEFWAWAPGTRMRRGVWDIPIPRERKTVHPWVLLVPVLGFDAAGYRLGYGGGYYDRTLAEMEPKPLTIGIGYEFGALESIFPQPHDVPMDLIVTEAGVKQSRLRSDPLARNCSRAAQTVQPH